MRQLNRRRYRELFRDTGHFTKTTRKRLERAIGHALLGSKSFNSALRVAARHATRELQASGFDAASTLEVLSAIVEEAGRACGADRLSLLSREPQWTPVRTFVLESARQEFAAEPAPGPREAATT